jgi:uncharacterized DUF497 family protein
MHWHEISLCVRISEIVWTDGDVEHIARHGVDPDEVEQAIASDPVWRRGRRHLETGRQSLYALGRTDAGRYLFVVLSPLGPGRARCVTAREMDDATRRYYQRRRR